ncbi:Ppx/GppA phosphatase family protein [Desertivirga xinjiangensis]|uniref:Ppx/GppA phosphatase family protein n=1 Tax=Desertivirga xinjiangensis TaxID=539206 RepID=UPI00210C9B48|nr:exopolyphosphatase [Pedobacter xinjiangensis]
MNKRIAALDLGTNTFHLVVAEVNNNKFNKIIEEQRHVKLGEGGITEGKITDAAFRRGIEALREFKSVIADYNVDLIQASGTSALRSAVNGIDFINEVMQETGICIEIIEGDVEAELIYKGVRAVSDLRSSTLIMDIGGGSVEFIFCNGAQIFWKKSYPIGAARLMAMFHHSDPISIPNMNAIEAYLQEPVEELKDRAREYKPQQLIGSAGAFETFAALVADKHKGDQQILNLDNYSFEPSELKSILTTVLVSTHRERVQNKLIIPVRTDMIVVASVLTKYLIEQMNFPVIRLSRFALKEGLLVQAIEKANAF